MSNEASLFICLTPLQMKIAERIIIEEKIVNYKLICISLSNNDKYSFYYEKLKEHSSESFVYYPKDKAKGFTILNDVYSFKKRLLKSGILCKISNVYLASIDNRYVQLIVSLLNIEKINTFDDGLANLNYEGSYYKIEKLNFIKKILWRMVGVRFLTQNIREKSRRHYTLYKGRDNIATPLFDFELIKNIVDNRENAQSEINVFLGQPLYEVNSLADNYFINDILKKIKIDIYFPHPREKYLINSSIDVRCSELIFEDYILNIYKENIDLKKINIFTFFSTAALNLDNLDFISCYVILNTDYFNKDVYEIFNDFNVEFIDGKI